MTRLRIYRKIGAGVYRITQTFSKSVKWHYDSCERPRKDLGNIIIQIGCSFQEILMLWYCLSFDAVYTPIRSELLTPHELEIQSSVDKILYRN